MVERKQSVLKPNFQYRENKKRWVLVLLALVVGIYLFLAQVHRDLTGWGIGDGFLQTLYKRNPKSLAKTSHTFEGRC